VETDTKQNIFSIRHFLKKRHWVSDVFAGMCHDDDESSGDKSTSPEVVSALTNLNDDDSLSQKDKSTSSDDEFSEMQVAASSPTKLESASDLVEETCATNMDICHRSKSHYLKNPRNLLEHPIDVIYPDDKYYAGMIEDYC